MDSKESKHKNNSSKSDGAEKKKSPKSTPRQVGQGDNDDELFTCSASQSSSFVPVNGTRAKLGSHFKEPGPPCTSTDKPVDILKSASSSNQSKSVNKVNFNDGLSEAVAASTSRSSLSTNNGIEGQSPKYTVCTERAGSNLPSTSGTSKSSGNNVFINKESRKRPSSLKLNRPNFNDESSSDTGNDDYSLGSEDGCVYTYRGGEHLADLPSSFFSLDMGLPLDRNMPVPHNYQVQQGAAGNAREARGDPPSGTSSPDMDYLEMDFDPGPSCEVETDDESSSDSELDAPSNMPEESAPVIRAAAQDFGGVRFIPLIGPLLPPLRLDMNEPPMNPPAISHQPSTSRVVTSEIKSTSTGDIQGPYITHINTRGEHLLVRRTMSHGVTPASVHLLDGDLVTQRDTSICPEEFPEGSLAFRINRMRYPSEMTHNSYHVMMAKKIMMDKIKAENDAFNSEVADGPSEPLPCSSTSTVTCVEPPRCMLWPEKEACERQVTQIGASACGATAVINVFNALGVPVNVERINASVTTRLRANNAPLPRYLLSRAVAGCTAAELVTGIHRASEGLVSARFFPTYPERAMSLSHWLADWISLGAVPILTLNLQRGCEGDIPDAWHHQMVFGVSPRGIYLCNPAECVRENTLWSRLVSPSELLLRSRDVAARFTPATDLTPLMHVPDQRFHTLNVMGQVANVLREWRAGGWQEQHTRTRYVRIPAAYQAGITVAAITGGAAHARLMNANELPLLEPPPPNTPPT